MDVRGLTQDPKQAWAEGGALWFSCTPKGLRETKTDKVGGVRLYLARPTGYCLA